YQANSWVAAVATTGVILGAAYMLYLYWRMAFGTARTTEAAAMPDLDLREWLILAPIAAATLWMGVYPESFMAPMRGDVQILLDRIDRARPEGAARPTAGHAAPAAPHAGAAVAMLIARSWFGRDRDYRAEYPVLIIFSAVGMGMMVSASDLLTLYVGLELQSLAAYVLASFQRSDTRSAEAGLKYFVLGALASGILLYGISLLYGFTGTTQFGGIADRLAGGPGTGQLFGIVFVLAGLAFKVSAVPFHMWTPDVYEGAPTPVTGFFA